MFVPSKDFERTILVDLLSAWKSQLFSFKNLRLRSLSISSASSYSQVISLLITSFSSKMDDYIFEK